MLLLFFSGVLDVHPHCSCLDQHSLLVAVGAEIEHVPCLLFVGQKGEAVQTTSRCCTEEKPELTRESNIISWNLILRND